MKQYLLFISCRRIALSYARLNSRGSQRQNIASSISEVQLQRLIVANGNKEGTDGQVNPGIG